MIIVYQTIILLCHPYLIRSETLVHIDLNASYHILMGQLAGPYLRYLPQLLLLQFSKLVEVQYLRRPISR